MDEQSTVLVRLMATIEDRKAQPPPRSYTTTLFEAGVEKIGEKIMEEAGEVVQAARETDDQQRRQHLIHEAADVIYHLFVMLAYRDVRLEQVVAELEQRFGTSGLDEKESRSDR